MAYTGSIFFLTWGLWSMYTYDLPYLDMYGYMGFIGKTIVTFNL